MKKIIFSFSLFVLQYSTKAQQNDIELNRDSVLGWRYLTHPPKPQAYKPIKDNYASASAYSVWQQQTADMLFDWLKRSVLPKGLVITDQLKENNQWWLDGAPALHSYGTQLIGFDAHFVNGKIDLHCCEKGYLLGLGVNNFPGKYLTKGFNPKGLYFFAEKPRFSTGDDEAKLTREGLDKQILSTLHPYRTYLDHYHNNGKAFNTIGIVVAKNGEWPFKPVLVKDAVDYIDQQLSAYPAILQKNAWLASVIKQQLERLKPYYNEVVKLKDMNFNNAMITDDNGHAIIDPGVFINGNTGNKTFAEYFILVSTTRQTIDQAKTDAPLWIYLNCPTVAGDPAQYDPAFSTGSDYFIHEIIRNFNFDYAYRWLADPEKMKNQIYKPLQGPAASHENNASTMLIINK